MSNDTLTYMVISNGENVFSHCSVDDVTERNFLLNMPGGDVEVLARLSRASDESELAFYCRIDCVIELFAAQRGLPSVRLHADEVYARAGIL